MIIKNDDSEIQSIGVVETEQFTIGDPEMIITHLRENTYTNPLRACIREIAANARDANREVGKENVPIEIIMPTDFDPSIKIRDSGPGLSPDRIHNVYTKYGSSTKRLSNLETGGFGIGAKSPFAYVDQFTVVSRVMENGSYIQRTYIAVKEGAGDLRLVSEIPSEVCSSGVEISIPIKREDRYNIKDYVAGLFKFWDVKPKVTGDRIDLVDPPLIEDEYFSLFKSKQHHRNLPSCLFLDGFDYDLRKIDNLSLLCDNSKQIILYANVALKFKTGEIDLALSRDDIRFSPKSIKAISNRIDYVYENLRNYIVSNIENASSYKEAMEIFSDLKKSFYNAYKFQSELDKLFSNIYWKGVLVNSKIISKDIGKWCRCYEYSRRVNKRFEITEIINHEFETYHSGNVKIFTSQTESLDRKLIDYLFVKNSYNKILVVAIPQEPKFAEFLEEQKNNPNVLVEYDQKLLSHLNFDKIEDLSLPENLKIRSKRITSEPDYSFLVGRKLEKKSTNYSEYGLTNPFRIKNDGGVYVIIDSENYYHTKWGLTKEIPSILLNLLKKDVYAYTHTRAKHLTDKWITLDQALIEALKSAYDSFFESYTEYIAITNLGKNSIENICDLFTNVNVSKYKDIFNFIEFSSLILKNEKSFQELDSILESFKKICNNSNIFDIDDLSKFWRLKPNKIDNLYFNVKHKYPLIEYLAFYNADSCRYYRKDKCPKNNEILNYIEMCNK